MGISVVYTCDQCNTQKKETNKWFQITRLNSAIRIEALDYKETEAHNRAIICGESCVQKYVSKALPTLHALKQS